MCVCVASDTGKLKCQEPQAVSVTVTVAELPPTLANDMTYTHTHTHAHMDTHVSCV